MYLYYNSGVQREVVSIALSFWGHTTVVFGGACYRMDGDKMFSIQTQEGFYLLFLKVFLGLLRANRQSLRMLPFLSLGGLYFVVTKIMIKGFWE